MMHVYYAQVPGHIICQLLWVPALKFFSVKFSCACSINLVQRRKNKGEI